jgi:hypothetical protein
MFKSHEFKARKVENGKWMPGTNGGRAANVRVGNHLVKFIGATDGRVSQYASFQTPPVGYSEQELMELAEIFAGKPVGYSSQEGRVMNTFRDEMLVTAVALNDR